MTVRISGLLPRRLPAPDRRCSTTPSTPSPVLDEPDESELRRRARPRRRRAARRRAGRGRRVAACHHARLRLQAGHLRRRAAASCSRPGTGASDRDLAAVYEAWGGFAYGRGLDGAPAGQAMRDCFERIEVAVKNVDSREHDILDSDDYYQYHGGMVATIRALSGREPAAYLGDSADPRAWSGSRTLAEETRRVFRARVANPHWIASMIRHGYKGAAELAATVDYLFGYDAMRASPTDWMYEQVAERYCSTRTSPRSCRAPIRGRRGRSPSGCSRRPSAGMWAAPEDDTLGADPRALPGARGRAGGGRHDRAGLPAGAIVGQQTADRGAARQCRPSGGRRRARARRARHREVHGGARAGAAAAAVEAAVGDPYAFGPGQAAPGGVVSSEVVVELRAAPLVELPLGATLDRLVGALDLRRCARRRAGVRAGPARRARTGDPVRRRGQPARRPSRRRAARRRRVGRRARRARGGVASSTTRASSSSAR